MSAERPVNMAAVRQAKAELRRLLRENPRLGERTAAMLAGELPCPDLNEEEAPTMARPRGAKAQITVRLPEDHLARLDALMPRGVASAPELALTGAITRSDLVRLCVLRALPLLEVEFPALPGTEAADG